ncbi:N-acetylmuramoyl-L-alanine amidase [Latilactobacillus fuchuensis]|uniref:N-acetylmuramoyl-L-alanine amidase n=1 Tax=Latilactobacillus fuchuensis TaxID=164393 RepID=UPI0039B07EC3
MKNRWTQLLIGAAMLSTVGLLATGQVDAATVLTPAEMKSQLTQQDIQEATPNKAETEKNTVTNDDIGMPIEEGAGTPYARSRASYPNVNNYIYQNNISHPNITTELHQFEMFNYSTNDGKPTGIVVHYTDNPTNYSARNEANYVINGGWESAFVHTFIDASSILNIHDTSYGAWGSGAVANKYFAHFEMVTA